MTNEVYFDSPQEFIDEALANAKNRTVVLVNGKHMVRSPAIWLTNIEHKKRHEPLKLMTLARNIKYSRHKEIKGVGYKKYDNYDAIEVPFTDAIPDDYEGVMGVPITFLDKYCPEQFEIVGKIDTGAIDEYNIANPVINGKSIYKRIAIRRRVME